MADLVQKGNTVRGDLAGGNIVKTTILEARKLTLISRLNQQLARELSENANAREMSERLRHHIDGPEGANPLGVELKLKRAQKDLWIGDAIRLKEGFSKRLFQYNLSPSGDALFTFLLVNVLQRFNAIVAPHLHDGTSDALLRKTLFEELVRPVFDELEDNPLGLMPDEIEGVVWFLTGNCFIRWD